MPVLTIDGLGDVRLDQPIADAGGANPAVEWANAYCDGYGAWVQAGTASTYGRADFTIDDTSDSSMTGRVTTVVVFGGYSTDTGISVGSTEAEVVAAYPSASLLGNTDPYKSYQISDRGRLQFFLSDGVVAAMAAISADVDPNLNVGPNDWYYPCL